MQAIIQGDWLPQAAPGCFKLTVQTQQHRRTHLDSFPTSFNILTFPLLLPTSRNNFYQGPSGTTSLTATYSARYQQEVTDWWKLNKSLLNEKWVKTEIEKEIQSFSEMSENENPAHSNLWVQWKYSSLKPVGYKENTAHSNPGTVKTAHPNLWDTLKTKLTQIWRYNENTAHPNLWVQWKHSTSKATKTPRL